jgi:hypothetical membrane protein
LLWIVGPIEFVIGMGLTQWGWDQYRNSVTPVYSLSENHISDLGAVYCGEFTMRQICSPWHDVFNVSIVLVGLLLLIGLALVISAFRPGRLRTLGFVLFALSSAGTAGVGLSPEDVDLTGHATTALIAFSCGGVALIVFGLLFRGDPRWSSAYVPFSIVSGLVALVALVLYVGGLGGPLGAGGAERLVVAPILLWTVLVGIRLARLPPLGAPNSIAHAGGTGTNGTT